MEEMEMVMLVISHSNLGEWSISSASQQKTKARRRGAALHTTLTKTRNGVTVATATKPLEVRTKLHVMCLLCM